jgi:hypothetical protein
VLRDYIIDNFRCSVYDILLPPLLTPSLRFPSQTIRWLVIHPILSIRVSFDTFPILQAVKYSKTVCNRIPHSAITVAFYLAYLINLAFRNTYYFHSTTYCSQSIADLDTQFEVQCREETQWPGLLPLPKTLYDKFRQGIHRLARNLICASCGCIFHDSNVMQSIPFDHPSMFLFRVDPALIPYNCSTGIATFDQQHLLIEKMAIHFKLNERTPSLWLCDSCSAHLTNNRLPPSSLANYRWVGEPPDVLKDLTWIEERLVARAHISGAIYRLERKSNCSYLGLKGHVVIYPQDSRGLLDILPLPPSRLPETIRVVWTGASTLTLAELQHQLSIRTLHVYNALHWLCHNNEDYKNVTVDYAEFARWPPVFVADDLLHCMGHISDNVAEQIARSSPAAQDNDSYESESDVISASGLLDTNDISRSNNGITLRRLACLVDSDIIKVIHGSNLISSWDNTAYFTSAFPTLFPYGTGKHKDSRRTKHLTLKEWVSLLLRHCSRFVHQTVIPCANYRRFQRHPCFVMLAFDVLRRDHAIKQTSIQTCSKHWSMTDALLHSLAPEQLLEAANQAERYESISDPAVKVLLRAVDRVGTNVLGSDAKRFHMFSELKSLVIYRSLPIIYVTLNPGDLHSPLALFYAGEEIDISEFLPQNYSPSFRRETMARNPLVVVEYFHTTVQMILSALVKGGLFGEVLHHYGTIEYQGRGTPHIHLLVNYTRYPRTFFAYIVFLSLHMVTDLGSGCHFTTARKGKSDIGSRVSQSAS